MNTSIHIPREAVAELCRRWKIVEFSIFGSVVRSDFDDESDIDVLVRFAADSRHTLFDLVRIQDELEMIFGRKVHVASRRAIEASRNPIRRDAILRSAQVVYAA